MVLKLYSVSDGPPSLSVRQTLTQLQVPFELVNVDFGAGDHMTEEYAQVRIVSYNTYLFSYYSPIIIVFLRYYGKL